MSSWLIGRPTWLDLLLKISKPIYGFKAPLTWLYKRQTRRYWLNLCTMPCQACQNTTMQYIWLWLNVVEIKRFFEKYWNRELLFRKSANRNLGCREMKGLIHRPHTFLRFDRNRDFVVGIIKGFPSEKKNHLIFQMLPRVGWEHSPRPCWWEVNLENLRFV